MADEFTTIGIAFLVVFVISYTITFFVFGGSSFWDLVDPNSKPVYYGLPVSLCVAFVGSALYYSKVYS